MALPLRTQIKRLEIYVKNILKEGGFYLRIKRILACDHEVYTTAYSPYVDTLTINSPSDHLRCSIAQPSSCCQKVLRLLFLNLIKEIIIILLVLEAF
jgi:hypothetical protein